MIYCVTTKGLIRVLHVLGRRGNDLRVHDFSGRAVDIPLDEIETVHCFAETIESIKHTVGEVETRHITFVPRSSATL